MINVTGETQRFTVRGEIECDRVCNCPYCQGHVVVMNVDKTVLAIDEDTAIQKTVQLILDRGNFGDAKWIGKNDPKVQAESLPEDERMRLIGAPLLPQLQDA